MINRLKENLLSIGLNIEQANNISFIISKEPFELIDIESATNTAYLTFGQKFTRAVTLEIQVLTKERYFVKIWVFIEKTHAWFGKEFGISDFDKNLSENFSLTNRACSLIQNPNMTTADLWRELDHESR